VLPAPQLPDWLAALLPFDRYRMDVGGYAMHVMEVGRGRPVLLLHGNPTWGFLYRRVAGELTGASLRLIMPDLIGLGFSDKPRSVTDHQLDAHGAWIGALIDRLDLQNMIFVGQDWGGPIGLRALADRRDRLAGLVILNTVVGPPRPGFRPTRFHRFANMPLVSDLAFRMFQVPQSMLGRAQAERASISGTVARAYRYPLRNIRERLAPLGLARMVPNNLEHPSIEPLRKCQSVVETFQGPTAIVWGERDPILGRVRSHVERMLPRARVTLTQAGHFVPEEAPEEIADAIRFVAGKLGDP
jgi:haloalkane dehalogenase